jgi:putative spermidine/putrescine transport system permease protein
MPRSGARVNWAPWLFSAPAFAVFVSMLLTPLLLTGVLSLHAFDGTRGILDTYTFDNYLEVLTDSYYHEIFARTAIMSAVVTLLCIAIGVPETVILSRMRGRWRGIFLLVILAPLLISVIVRTLGWSILLGTNGLVNTILISLGVVDSPVRMVFTMTGLIIAMVHVMGGRRLKVVATAAYDEFLSTLNWPLGATVALLLLAANIIVIVGCNRWVERRFRPVFEG